MCNICDFDHSLSLPEITKVVRNILYNGIVDYDIPHFKEMMKKRKISIVDVNNVLRAGKHYGPEYVSGEWRHEPPRVSRRLNYLREWKQWQNEYDIHKRCGSGRFGFLKRV